ncbi:MAG TPA: type II secretion system F family protein [Candidatus Binataceae bacterium]|nr:type II secretion system F family protein [Candidatus Binataceae bacterium]
MDLLISTGVFALVLVIAVVLILGRGDERDRAAELLEEVTREHAETDEFGLMRTRGRHRAPVSASSRQEVLAFIYRLNLMRRFEESMWQAGIYMRVSEILLVVVLLAGAGIGAGEIFWHSTLFALATGAGLCAIPIFYVRIRRKRRMKAFAMQLPFALDLIKSSLEAGHSLLRGLQVLVQEFADPLGGEFRTVLEQARLGMPLGRAFDELLTRVPEEDLRLLVVAIKVQSEVGSSLAQIVGRLSEIVRTRQRLQQQIHAMTAQSRMSGMIVGLLPAIVLAAFSVVQPSYAHVLFLDPMGQKALKAAIVLDAMAFFTIRKILQVNY